MLIFLVYSSPGTQPMGPSGLRYLSTQQILEQRLPKQIEEPWVWSELESRLKAGSLSQRTSTTQ